MLPHEQVIELLPAYAVGCLDEGELSLVAEHVKTCPECRLELQAYQSVAAQLPYSIRQVEPPARVKEELMSKARATARPSSARPDVARPSWGERFSSFFQRFSPAWSLASLAIIAVLVTSNLLLWKQVSGLQSQSANTMSVVTLGGTEAAPGATGLIVVSLDGEHGTLVVDHLPPLSPDQQYQLWLIKDGQRTSGGVFSVNKEGYGALWVHSDRPLADYAAFGVTIEPEGGSPGPTGKRVLAGAF